MRTDENRRQLRRHLGWMIVLLAVGAACAGARMGVAAESAASEQELSSAAKLLQGTVRDLEKVRDKVAAELGARTKADAEAGANHDMFLRFDEGADEEETHMVLRRRGKNWLTSYAVVPQWRQESFHELFAYAHRGRNRCITRDRNRYPVDASAVSFDGASLGGKMTATYKLDTTREERYPPGTPTRWSNTGQKFTTMEKLATLNHHKDRVQSYTLNAKALEGIREFDLWLVDAIDKRATLQVRFQVPAQPWIRGIAWGLNWNCGYHSIDATGLTCKDGVLEGPLMVALNPDAWYPKKPHYMVYNLKAKINGRLCEGGYTGEGDFGECSGVLRGEAGNFICGTFESSGDLGAYHAMVFGRVMPAREDVPSLLIPATKAEREPEQVVRSLVARTARLYSEIRGLCMATTQYPLPIEVALAQTKAAAPEWGTDGALVAEQVASIASFAGDAKALVEACVAGLGKENAAVVGSPDCGDPTFGPFGRVEALSATTTNVFALPAGIKTDSPQEWAHIPYWDTLSPLKRVDDLDHNTVVLPEIIPADGASYEAEMSKIKFPKEAKRPPRVMKSWEPMVSRRGKLVPPWSSWSPRGRSHGAVWFARTTLVSDKAQDLWVALSAKAHGKLWVNGKLAWVAPETMWRNQQRRESVLRISLNKGDNKLLLRGREDRNETWLRMHFCVQGAPNPESKPMLTKADADAGIVDSVGDGSGRFLNAANPPLAWNIDEGRNVAWTRSLPGKAVSGAAAVAGKLFMCCAPDLVVCLDQKSGAVLWKKELAGTAGRSRGAIVADGKMVWACLGGQTAGYDLDGNEKWRVAADGERANLAAADGRLLVESGSGRGDEPHTCAALDAVTGEELWKTDIPGGYNSFGLHVLRLRNGDSKVDGVVPESRQFLDLKDGRVLCGAPDSDHRDGSRVYMADGVLVYAKRSTVVAHRYMLDPHGRVVTPRIWQNQYGIKYDSHKMVLIAGRYAMIIGTVQEDCKGHSNAAVRELYAYDRETGRPVTRIKPALLSAQSDGSQSTYVAPYVFVHDSGGGSSGGHPTHGQIAVIHIGGTPRLVSRNYIPLGTGTPVFDGSRMFLTGGGQMWCVAVTDDKGRQYQDEQLASAMFERLWNVPKSEKFARPEKFPTPPPYGTVAISRLEDSVGLPHWMVAGPFPLPAENEDASVYETLAALRPKPGDALALVGTMRKFAALPQEAVSTGYTYGHEYYLCGIGGVTATVKKEIDVLSCTGGKKDQCAVLYTVVENSRPRVASLMIPSKGVEVWMGGIKLKPFQTVELDPGAYALTARVRPDKMGKKAGTISIAFRNRDDPRAARQVWFRKVNAAEDQVKGVAKTLAARELGEKANSYLRELGGYKASLDAAQLVRSALNGGSGMFANARPPVPWERGTNLRWKRELPGEIAASPVASGDSVYVSVKPNLLVCCDRRTGEISWKAEVPKTKSLSAPAVSKDAVYVADAAGAIARFRLNGTTVWTKSVKGSSGAGATAMVANGMLVVRAGALFGVDMETGETVWTAKLKGSGAPAVATLEGNPVVLTCDGTILNAANGKTLVSGLPAGDVAPQLAKGVVYSPHGGTRGRATATRVSARQAPEKLWERSIGAEIIATPVVADGVVYVLGGNGEIASLSAADGAAPGRHLLEMKPVKGRSALLLGGTHLFATGLGDGTQTIVIKPGEKLEPMWMYTVAGGTSAPGFLANSEFLAGGKSLFCIDGKPPVEPGEYTPLPKVEAASGYEPGDGVPVVKFEDNQMPMKWLFSTPTKPQTLETDFLAAAGTREKAKVAAGQKVKHGDSEITFMAVDAERSIWSHPKFTAGFDSVDVRIALASGEELTKKKNDHSTVYLYTVIDNDKPRFVELCVLTPGGDHWNKKEQIETAMWLNGAPVKDRDVVELAKGKIPFMIQASVGTCGSTDGKIWMAPRLIDRTDKYAGERDRHAATARVWKAFQTAKGEPFVLR